MQTLAVDDVVALGSCGNALIVVWRDAPTPPALERIRLAVSRLLEEFPAGIGLLGVSGALPLSCADDRQRLSPLLNEVGARVLGLASVIEGSEPTRNLVASINMVVRHPCPLRVFSNIDEGAAWLAPLLGKAAGRAASALRHAAEGLRRELQRGPMTPVIPN
jgi:hypothetical protein